MCGEFSKWMDLPPEMKRMCIDRMHMETRLKLRATATTERKLVDSAKNDIAFIMTGYPAEQGSGQSLYCSFIAEVDKPRRWIRSNLIGIEKTMQLIGFSIKYQKFGAFSVRNIAEWFWPALFHQILENGPIRTHFLNVEADLLTTKKLLENCEPKCVDLDFPLEGFNTSEFETESLDEDSEQSKTLCELAKTPGVFNAKSLHLRRTSTRQFSFLLVHEWDRRDAKIGTRFYFPLNDDAILDLFVRNWPERLIDKESAETRVVMSNPEKHIVINRQLSDYYTVFVVVASEMKDENEYRKFMERDQLFDQISPEF